MTSRAGWSAALILLYGAGCYHVDGLSQELDASVDLSSPENADGGGINDLSSPDLPPEDSSVMAAWEAVQSGVTANLRAITADGKVLYVAGAGSTVLRIAADGTLTKETPGPGFNLRGAAAAGGDVWLVGDDGTVLTRAASGWAYATMGDATLNAAFGLGAGDFVDVGSAGHFDRNLLSEDTGVSVNLFAVWGRSADDLFAVGEAGTILHRASDGGVPWTSLTSNTTSDLHGVHGSGSTLYAAGTAGVLLRSDDGNLWSAESTGSTADLYAVWLSGSEAFAVGSGGTILHRAGATWTVEHTGGPALRAVLGRSVPGVAADVWAVGDDGTILHRQP